VRGRIKAPHPHHFCTAACSGAKGLRTRLFRVEIACGIFWQGETANRLLWLDAGGGRTGTFRPRPRLIHYGAIALVAGQSAAAARKLSAYIKLAMKPPAPPSARTGCIQATGHANHAHVQLSVGRHPCPGWRAVRGDGGFGSRSQYWPTEDVHWLARRGACGIRIAAGEKRRRPVWIPNHDRGR